MRVINNTSYIINPSIENEWIEFMHENYVKYIKDKQLSLDVIFTKVSIDQPEGKTYSLQIVFESEKHLELFLQQHQGELDQKLIKQYHGRYLSFSSVLTEV